MRNKEARELSGERFMGAAREAISKAPSAGKHWLSPRLDGTVPGYAWASTRP